MKRWEILRCDRKKETTWLTVIGGVYADEHRTAEIIAAAQFGISNIVAWEYLSEDDLYTDALGRAYAGGMW